MMLARRTSLAAIMVISVLLTALPATAGPSASQASLTIRLISTPGRTAVRDLPPKDEPNKGDTVSGTSILRNAVAQFDRPKGARVGSDSYVITLTSASQAQIKLQVKLPGGTLRAQGRTTLLGSSLRIPVVGGTGAFAGARGTGEAQDRRDGTSLNIYRLRLP